MSDPYFIGNPSDSKSDILVEFQDEEGLWKKHVRIKPGRQASITKKQTRVTTEPHPYTIEHGPQGITLTRRKLPTLKNLTASVSAQQA